MKLIEADTLLEREKPRGISDDVWRESSLYKVLNNAPTVEAIPVEWIKEQKQKYDSIIERLSGIAEYDDYVDDAIVRTNTLNNLLCDWAEREEE